MFVIFDVMPADAFRGNRKCSSGIPLLVTMLVKNKKSTEKVLDFVGVEGFEPPTLCL
jgi:hypothetical protein